MHHSIEA